VIFLTYLIETNKNTILKVRNGYELKINPLK
jgi:hypothetical protein